MVPNEKDSDGSGFDGDDADNIMPGAGRDRVIDLAGDQDDGFSAGNFDEEIDITGDEQVDFADELTEKPERSGLKKIVAPALVLAMAAGVGGYILMNPGILSGSGDVQATSVMAYQTQPADQQDPAAIAAEQAALPEGAPADVFSDTLPQPTVNQNEMPRGPEDGQVATDLTENQADPAAATLAEAPTIVDLTEEPALPVAEEAPAAPAEPESADVTEATEIAAAVTETPAVALEEPAAPAEPVEPVEDVAAESSPVAETVPVAEAPVAPPAESAPEITAAAEPVQEPEPVQDAVTALLDAEPTSSFSVAMAEPEAAVTPVAADASPVTEVVDAEPPLMPPPSSPQAAEDPVAAPAAAEQPAPVSAAQEVSGTAASPISPAAPVSQKDTYYDGKVLPGPMATEVGPRKVDPVMEPASQYVVVKKNYAATDFESLVASANRALKLKRYDSALEMFDQLYARNVRDQRVLMGLAVAQQNSGLSEAAIRTYEELLAISPNNADAMVNMLGLLRKQYPEVALRRLADLSDKFPNNAGVAAQLGIAHADMGHYPDAIRYLGIAATLQPQVAQHAYNMAIIADRNGDTKTAIRSYEKALEIDAVHGGGRSLPRESVYDRLAVLRRR